jgi:hypothetical protein
MFTNPREAGCLSAESRAVYGNARFGHSLKGKRGGNPRIYTTAHKAQRYYRKLRKELGLPPNTPIKSEAWRNEPD